MSSLATLRGSARAAGLAALLLCAGLTRGAAAQIDRINGAGFVTRSEVIARQGMAATSHPLATQIAVDVLRRGGSAVDAAIAANAALTLMEPTGCGLGGDLFAIVWDAKARKLHGLNGSGRSPLGLERETLAAELEKLGRKTIPPRGLLPISVPGACDAWFELHQRFGVLAMAEVLEPAIRYAKQGAPVPEYIAYQWGLGVRQAQGDKLPGAFLATFAPGGKAPLKGDLFANPDLARTLSLLAEQGRDAFYRGEIAERVDAFMAQHGGYLRKQDFERHRSTWVEPVSVNYRGFEVFELPPNGQGIAALQMLNLLEGFDLKALGLHSPECLHLMIEAKKLAFEDRARYYADPEFSKVPLSGLLSKEYAAERRKLIDQKRAGRSFDAGHPPVDDGDTIYLTCADAAGNMVSLIQSNYRGMGSGMAPPGLGFVFQDRGELFDLEPGRANSYAPGKRPFHTIIPGFVTKDGEAFLAFGVMGGDFQPQGHVQVLVNLLDFGMNLQEACDAPRLAHEGSSDPTGTPAEGGGTLVVEGGFAPEVLEDLKKRGHAFDEHPGIFGGFQGILRDPKTGVYFGASDPRKDGQAAGW